MSWLRGLLGGRVKTAIEDAAHAAERAVRSTGEMAEEGAATAVSEQATEMPFERRLADADLLNWRNRIDDDGVPF